MPVFLWMQDLVAVLFLPGSGTMCDPVGKLDYSILISPFVWVFSVHIYVNVINIWLNKCLDEYE